jgi:hypothetical protein
MKHIILTILFVLSLATNTFSQVKIAGKVIDNKKARLNLPILCFKRPIHFLVLLPMSRETLN